MTTCKVNEINYLIECQEEKLDSDPDGLCLMHSKMKDKDWESFEKKIKDKLKRNDYNFNGYFFHKPIDFRHTFEDAVNFSNAQFAGLANFRGAQFKGETYFDEVKFNGFATFLDAIFLNKVDFSFAEFKHDTRFNNAEFHNDANFCWVRFNHLANFNDTKFLRKDGSILFCNINF